MKARLFAVALVALVAPGCTYRYVVTPHFSDRDYARVNDILRDRRAELVLQDGSHLNRVDIRLSRESTLASMPDRDSTEIFSTGQLQRISFRRHERGALEGLGLGLLAGSAVGATFGLVFGTLWNATCGGDMGWSCYTMAEAVRASAGVGAGIGGVLGLSIGAARGSRVRIVVDLSGNALAASDSQTNSSWHALRASVAAPGGRGASSQVR